MADEVFVTVSQCQYTLFCCAVSVVFQQLIENCFKIQPQPSQKVMSVPECPWKNHNTFVVTDNKEEDSSDYALCSFFFLYRVHSARRLSIPSLYANLKCHARGSGFQLCFISHSMYLFISAFQQNVLLIYVS